jgi:hypothetical protein
MMVMAGYNGTLFGLLAITIIFIAAATRRREEKVSGRKRCQVPLFFPLQL